MRIGDFITEDTIPFPDRKGEVFRDKIKSAVAEFPEAMSKHNRQLAQSQEMLHQLQQRGQTNSAKFASPTTMSGYVKGIRSLEALSYATDGSGGENEQVQQFAQKFALEHLEDIVAAYRHDIKVCHEAMEKIRNWDHGGLLRYLLDPWFYYTHALEGELHSYAQLAKKHDIKLTPK